MKNRTFVCASLLLVFVAASSVATAAGLDSLFVSFRELNEVLDQTFENMQKNLHCVTTRTKKNVAACALNKKACAVEEFHVNDKFGLKITLPAAYAIEAPTVTVATKKTDRGPEKKHIEVVAKYAHQKTEATNEICNEAMADEQADLEAEWESFMEEYYSASWIDGVYSEARTAIVAKNGTITITRGLPAVIDEQQYTLTQNDNILTIEFVVKKPIPTVTKNVLTFTKKEAAHENKTKKVATRAAKKENFK
jgi:hypothetical protein